MSFEGQVIGSAEQWLQFIPVENKPIKYLEIGVRYGGFMFSVEKTYGFHKDSKLYGIDPWEDYPEYGEYISEQKDIYKSFLKNLANFPNNNKIIPIRGYSHKELSRFPDDFFDIIYIDGNHEPDYVMEDAVLSFRKLKKGGFIVFDDYGWGGEDMVKKGVDGFLQGYHKKIKYIGEYLTQVFVQKLETFLPPFSWSNS